MVKVLAFAMLGSIKLGLCATDASDQIEVFVPTDSKTPLEQFQLRVKQEELDPQKFLKFDTTEAHNGVPSIKLTSEAGEEMSLDGTAPIVLNPGRHYALRVWLKFSDLISAGEQRPEIGSEFIIYVHSSGEDYRVARIGASAESDGWVKAFLPFDSGQPGFDKVKVLFRLFALKGAIWICDPRIVEVPENFPHDPFFELPSGEKAPPGMLHYGQ